MAHPKHQLENPTIGRSKNSDAWPEVKAVAEQGSSIYWLDRPLVLPDALRKHFRPLQEASARVDFNQRDVVVLHGQEPAQQHPAAKQSFAGLPVLGDRERCLGEGHGEQWAELSINAVRIGRVLPEPRGRDRKR